MVASDDPIPVIPLLDREAMAAARERQASLTKPVGSLGRLEDLAVALAGMTGQVRPSFPRKSLIVLAADHGVALDGVSAYPREVTAQMVFNFAAGGAALNVLARQAGARVVVGDLGIDADLSAAPSVIAAKIGRGTANMTHGPAMDRVAALASIAAGLDIVEREYLCGVDLIAVGEMGIGNTTASSAIVAAMTGQPATAVVGRGTGVDDAGWGRKVAAVETALALNKPDRADPIDILSKVGGYEIGGLVGVMLGAAAHRVPIVLDGFITGAAALLAVALRPSAHDYLIASHVSVEVGHRIVLDALDLHPLLDLDLRLGEGSGALLAFALVDSAAAIMAEMATFAEAGVSTKEDVR